MRSEGSSRLRRISRRKLVFGRLVLTMMQSCASAAKLRGGGANLSVGIRASSNHGFPPPRIVNPAVRRKASASADSSVVTLVPVSPFRPLDVR
jgi:hypothetical protein